MNVDLVHAVGIAIGVFFSGFWFGEKHYKKKWMDFAVKAGKAEYYLDKHNQRQWRWKP